jgi:hypothetical protein
VFEALTDRDDVTRSRRFNCWRANRVARVVDDLADDSVAFDVSADFEGPHSSPAQRRSWGVRWWLTARSVRVIAIATAPAVEFRRDILLNAGEVRSDHAYLAGFALIGNLPLPRLLTVRPSRKLLPNCVEHAVGKDWIKLYAVGDCWPRRWAAAEQRTHLPVGP